MTYKQLVNNSARRHRDTYHHLSILYPYFIFFKQPSAIKAQLKQINLMYIIFSEIKKKEQNLLDIQLMD